MAFLMLFGVNFNVVLSSACLVVTSCLGDTVGELSTSVMLVNFVLCIYPRFFSRD